MKNGCNRKKYFKKKYVPQKKTPSQKAFRNFWIY